MMKTKIKLPAILLGLLLLLTGTTQNVMAQNEDVSLQSFYDELSPYGQWINDPQYGYVWRPDVDQEEFRPYYTNGRWAMTEYGNTWVSNYDWGWAPFHYGRWVYNRYNDWLWIPGTTWGPAWVSWRSGGGQYGWAPLGPTLSIGINIGRGGYRIPDMCWNFVPYNNIYYNNYPRYYGNRNRIYIQNTVIINNTYVYNNRTYYTGPRADDIRRNTNQNVTVYNVNRNGRPGASRIDNTTVNIYSPRTSRGSSNINASPREAVEASINRGAVSRDRGNNSNANQGVERGGNMNTRPSRDANVVNSVQPSRGMENRSGELNQGRNERGSQTQSQQRMERPQTQERVDRQQPQERSEHVQQAPQQQQQLPQQRTERSERPQPQQQTQPQSRERTQSAPPQRSSSGNESRESRGGESSGRSNGRVRGEENTSSNNGRVRGGE